MTELTPEERERIYLEEKARMEVRQELQNPPRKEKKPWSLAQIIGAAGLCALVLGFATLVGAFVSDAPASTSKGASTGDKTVRATYWCGVDFDDAGQVGIAVSRGDTAAIAGLMARGKAFQVEEGTPVYDAGEIDMGISLVHIKSGFQAGRQCYISKNALSQ